MDFASKMCGDGLDPRENEALYDIVMAARPEVAFEVGTRRGGGSTRFIASAMRANGRGMLYTAECDRACYDEAVALFDGPLSGLRPHVTLHHGKSHDIFPRVLEAVPRIDLLFLDGEENSAQTMREIAMFSPKLLPGAYLVCHDWNIHKMAELRPMVEGSREWEPILVVSDTQTGFAIYRKKG